MKTEEDDLSYSNRQLNELKEILKEVELNSEEINLYEYLPKLGYNVDEIIQIIILNNRHLVDKEDITDLLNKFNNEI